MTGYDEITTLRLRLRKLNTDDAAFIFRIFSDPEIIQYVNTELHKNIGDSEKLINKYLEQAFNIQGYMWAIENKESNIPVGIIGLLHMDHDHFYASFGSLLLKEYWNKSYNTEAHKALINYAFTKTKLNRIESQFYENHQAVESMLIKCGMKYEGILRENFYLHGRFVNSKVYSIIRSDFLNNREFYSFT